MPKNTNKSILNLKESRYPTSMTIAESLTTPVMPIKNSILGVIGEKYEKQVLVLFNTISKTELPNLTLERIKEAGFSLPIAKKVFSMIQFALAMNKFEINDVHTVCSPDDAYELFKHLQFEEQEHFAIAGLNTKNQVMFVQTIFVGTLNASVVHPREIFKKLLSYSGICSFVVCHNHPSGNTSPSQEDVDVTIRLQEAGELIGLELIDHIIIGDARYLSMKNKGYL